MTTTEPEAPAPLFARKLVPEVKVAWVTALRSKQYLQGFGRLHTPDYETDDNDSVPNGDCCLGVLGCVLLAQFPQFLGDLGWEYDPDEGCFFYIGPERDYEEESTNTEIPIDIADVIGLNRGEGVDPHDPSTNLVNLNDKERWSFDQIADLIEQWY